MKKILSVVFLLLASSSGYSQGVIIHGELKSFTNGTVYFTEGLNWSVPIDSARCRNGKFVFKIKASNLSFPFMASIGYKLRNGKFKLMMFNVKSRMHLIERSSVFICKAMVYNFKEVGFYKDNYEIILNLPEDDQNESYRNLIHMDFLIRSNQRDQRNSEYQKIYNAIRQHPHSYFAFSSIYRNRTFFKRNELASLLHLFSKSLRNSTMGEDILAYLHRLDCKNCKIPNLLLTDKMGQKKSLRYEKQVTIIIFWASWCRPCREEIPVVKKIYQEYGTLIEIISVSVDNDKDAWRTALLKEKMPWLQAWVEKKDAEKIKSIFDFQVIPFTIFIDNKGSEMTRFYGTSDNLHSLYKDIIDKQINR